MNRPALEAVRRDLHSEWHAHNVTIADLVTVLDALLAPAPPHPLDHAEMAALDAFSSKHFPFDGMVALENWSA